MKKITLNVIDRIMLLRELNITNISVGSYKEIKCILKIVDMIEFKEDESKCLGIELKKDRIQWNKEKEKTNKQIELEDAEADILISHFKKLDKEKKIKNDKRYVQLYEKIIELEKI